MNASLTRIERDIEATRTRLYDTIDRIQDKLTVPGIVDEVMGSRGMPRFDSTFHDALGLVRRNPVPVLILAAGIGWLLHRMGRDRAAARVKVVEASPLTVPPVVGGPTRIHDPGLAVDPESSPIEGGRTSAPI